MNVLCFELGDGTFAICTDSLKLPPPWSPPTFNQIVSSGIAFSCHESRFYDSNWSKVSVTNLARSVTYMTGVDFFSFPLMAVSHVKNRLWH